MKFSVTDSLISQFSILYPDISCPPSSVGASQEMQTENVNAVITRSVTCVGAMWRDCRGNNKEKMCKEWQQGIKPVKKDVWLDCEVTN